VLGCSEHGNEPSGSIEIPEKLRNWWLLKKGSGMTGRGKLKFSERDPPKVALCSPQIRHELPWN
jgi:hypothetical protein